jgi:RHS repeat-associated protein
MLKVYKDTTTNDMWGTYSRFDTSGRVLFSAQPSAVSGFDDNYADLVNFDEFGNAQYLRDSAGLFTNYSYSTSTTATTSTLGSVKGYVNQVTIQEGETGTAIPQQTTTYIARTAGSTTIYLPATVEAYEDEAGLDEVTTSYAYTFYSGTTQIESKTTTLPTGTGPDSETVYFDTYGRPTWMKDARGYLHYTEYDNKTGAVTKTIADVDASQTSDFAGKPSGWTTPGGGGVHAITSYEVDDLGRPTKTTDPNGNITYTVYNDTNHEIRIYPGWNTGTSAPTGPTIVVREDRDASYTEVLTMSATPSVASGRPTGAEAIGSLQSLTRTHLNSAGQAVSVDEYVSFASLSYSTSASLGTEGTHFYRTEQAYDKRGRASRVERADGTIYRTVFDGLGRPVSEWIGTNDTPVSGFWSPTNAAGMQQIKEYLYDGDDVGDSHLTSVEDANGHITSLAYDFRGRMLTTTLPDPDGGGSLTSPEYETAYDNLGRIISQADALNVVTYFTHNLSSRTTSITVPDSDGAGPDTAYTKSLVYDATGNLTVQSTELTSGVTNTYDGLGRVTRITQADPDGVGSLAAPYTDYAYDDVGNLRFVTDPLGNVTEYQYDKANRLVKIIQEDPDGGGSLTAPETDYAYDAAGFLASVTDPMERTVSYTYDRLGRKLTETLPDPDAGGSLTAPVTTWVYDSVGRIDSMTDPLSHTTDYEYDLFDRLITETLPDPDGGGSLTRPKTSYTYDDVGNLLTLTDPVDNVTTWVYDNLDQQISEENELGDFRYFAYDANGNLTQKTDRNGRVVEYVYDARNRLIEENWMSGMSVVRSFAFAYDGDSRLTSASDPAADYDYTYDDLGRVLTETQDFAGITPNIIYSSTYNAASLRTSLAAEIGGTDDFLNEYAYDGLNRQTQVKQSGQSGGNAVDTKRVDFDYNAAGQFDLISRFANLAGTQAVAETDFAYDGIGRIASIEHLISSTQVAAYDYTWDVGSRITSIDNFVDGVTDFGYDQTNQLTNADNPSPSSDEAYSFDENGNRTMSGYTIGTNNRISTDGTYSFTYDDEGNLLTKTNISTGYKEEYSWDYRNRLTGVTFKDNLNNVLKTVEHSYDYFNRWIRRAVDNDGPGGAAAVDTFFSYEGDSINQVLEFDGSAASDLSHRYLWGPVVDQIVADEVVSSISSAGNTLWALVDHLGSVRDIADRNESSGAVTVVDHRIFDGFGVMTSESNASFSITFGFTAKPLDSSTGLQNNFRRWYAAYLGEWMSEDPIGFAGGETSLDRYAGNAASNSTDPDGLQRAKHMPGWDGMGGGGMGRGVGMGPRGGIGGLGGGIGRGGGSGFGSGRGGIGGPPTSGGRFDYAPGGGSSPGGTIVRPGPAPSTSPSATPSPVSPTGTPSINPPSASPNTGQPSAPTPPKTFVPPTNPPQPPPLIPKGYVARPAKGNGTVYSPPGATGDADSIRIMQPNSIYKDGYWVQCNSSGQPINPATGKPGGRPETHVPLPPGYFPPYQPLPYNPNGPNFIP